MGSHETGAADKVRSPISTRERRLAAPARLLTLHLARLGAVEFPLRVIQTIAGHPFRFRRSAAAAERSTSVLL